MNTELKIHKDLDAWKRTSLITHYSSPILAIVDEVAKWAGAFKDDSGE